MTTIAKQLIPPIYPHGGPMYWRHETSGALAEAVNTYFNRRPLTSLQLDLLVQYCAHWINAPCWHRATPYADLRERIKDVTTATALGEWIDEAFVEGIDPF